MSDYYRDIDAGYSLVAVYAGETTVSVDDVDYTITDVTQLIKALREAREVAIANLDNESN